MKRYFYAIKSIEIGGRCVCNGHADNCDKIQVAPGVNEYQCNCQHYTTGRNCEMCESGYVQKKWRPGKYFLSRFHGELVRFLALCALTTTGCKYIILSKNKIGN